MTEISRIVRLTLEYEFYPDRAHKDLFDGKSESEIVEYARELVSDEIADLLRVNEIAPALIVSMDQE